MGRVLAFLALLLAGLAARPALAQEAPQDSPAIHAFCSLPATLDTPLEALATTTGGWDCEDREPSLGPERMALRFDLSGATQQPNFLIARRATLDAVHVLVRDRDGATRGASFTLDTAYPAHIGGFFKVPLPGLNANSTQVFAVFDGVTQPITFSQAHLAPDDPGDDPAGRKLLLALAALSGMLLLPLFFNLAFYRVLRQSFVLWHSLLTLAILGQIVFNSGLSIHIVDLSVTTINAAYGVAFGVAVASAAMFAWSYIEPGKLDPRLRRTLPLAAAYVVAINLAQTFFPTVHRESQSYLFYIAHIPILLLFVAVLVDALRRGSRAAKFQAAGWIPLLLVGLLRLLGQLTPLMAPTDALMLFYVGTVLEVLATTMGVADRFLALRLERDRAQAEALSLEKLAEHDALTGLMNRRAIGSRFDELHQAGFDCFALIDLDHFKRINDSFGHEVGDQVLRATAKALSPDRDTMALRMGGEEFLLLLRGEKAQERAEQRRQAITSRVASMVPGLDSPVTASMGLVEIPRSAMKRADFGYAYSSADKLLYEAKEAGRNRTVAQRLQGFPVERRRQARGREVA